MTNWTNKKIENLTLEDILQLMTNYKELGYNSMDYNTYLGEYHDSILNLLQEYVKASSTISNNPSMSDNLEMAIAKEIHFIINRNY